jgi:hypothetical protein
VFIPNGIPTASVLTLLATNATLVDTPAAMFELYTRAAVAEDHVRLFRTRGA